MKYRLLKFFSYILCSLSHKNIISLGNMLGILYFYLIKKQRNRAIATVKMAFNYDDEKAQKLVKESFKNLCTNVLEILYMPRLKKDNLAYIEFEGLDILKREYEKNKGIVILTAHFGTWEWLAAGLSASGFSVTALAKTQPDSQYTKLLDEYREMMGVEIFARGAASELLAASKALKKGKILGFLADQDAGPGGAFIDFLGKKASTPMGPAVFARKFSSPVVPAFILRKEDGSHLIKIFEPIPYIDTGNSDEDLYNFTYKMTKLIEEMIIKNPALWIWFQKRWNTPVDVQKIKHHVVNKKMDK